MNAVSFEDRVMKIPRGLPDPGRVARSVTGRTTDKGAAQGPEAKASRGLHSTPPPPAKGSTAGLLREELTQRLAGGEERGNEAHRTALTNVAQAVAGSGAGRARDGIRAAVAGTSAPPSALGRLAIGQRKALVDTIGAVREGATEAAKAAFERVATDAEPGDVNSLVQHVIRESYTEATKDLAFFAEKVKTFNDLKESVREKISEARSARPSTDLGGPLQTWEEKLQSVGDDAQLANLDMQNALQRQQQALQMMSNIAKTLHDTATAVIRKIG